MSIRVHFILWTILYFGNVGFARDAGTNYQGPICINRDWTFNYFPENDEPVFSAKHDFDDKKWAAVALPHTWSVYETTRELHPFILNPSEQDDPYWWKGWGCYRKRMFLGAGLKEKKVFLEFDGVQKYARVYVNGKFVADHKGGFTSFSVDISDHLNLNRENLIVVMVSNQRNDVYKIPPMTAGNWNLYGGIYRSVRLVLKNRVFIPFQGSADHEGGSFITTSNESYDSANLSIKTFVKNESAVSQKCTLEISILGPSGNLVETIRKEHDLPVGTLETFVERTVLKKPQLWSPEAPHLYKAVISVIVNGKLSDTYQSHFGVRWYRWDKKENALYLNDQKVNIKGTNRHQEYPWLGDAIPRFITTSDMLDIRVNLGHNFMRAGHYINDPYLYHLADSLGVIMVEEVPNIKSIDFSEEVQEQNVREMIRRDRNHPSILFWSMGNETSDAADSRWALEEDSTRIIHLRKGENGGAFIQHTHADLDLEQLLRVTIRGWFDSSDAPKGFSSTPVSGQAAGNETWQWRNAMIKDGSTRGILGENCSAWLYADHGCDREYQNAPLKHVNAKGWVDAYREPKYIYYLTQALYTDHPVVYIHPDTWRAQYLDQDKDITVDSNCDEIELFVDGVSKGKLSPLDKAFPTVTFKNIVVSGYELKAVGTKKGKRYEHIVRMPGKAFCIELETKQSTIVADRSGIALIRAVIKDNKGNIVTGAANKLIWNVSGQGTLIGAPVYESDLSRVEANSGSGYTVIPVSNLVRSTNVPGKITIEVSSPGLKGGTLTIQTIKTISPGLAGVRLPELSDSGREKVSRRFLSESIDFILKIKPMVSDRMLKKANHEEYGKTIASLIEKENDRVDKKDTALKIIIRKIANSVVNQQGELVADDYNFFVSRYNQFITLKKLIESRNFHVTYEDLLKRYYQNSLIRNDDQTVDFPEIFQVIKSTPSRMIALRVSNPTDEHIKGTIEKESLTHSAAIYERSFREAINVLYPGMLALDKDMQGRILNYLVKINPQLVLDGDLIVQPDTSGLIKEDAVMAFIPDFDYLKSLK